VYKLFWKCILIISLIITSVPLKAELLPEEIVILVNNKSPDSVRIGRLYAKLRKVPSHHLIKIQTPMNERISRQIYDEFIAEPVRTAINRLYNKGEKIRCIVTTYGIPLHILPQKPLLYPEEEIKKYNQILTQKENELSRLKKEQKNREKPDRELNKTIKELENEINILTVKLGHLKGSDTSAAVDSELALLMVPDYPLAGWQPNPEYLAYKGRVTSYFGQVLMVSRLDAPSPELVENMIRTAIEVEKTGLSGILYLDARGYNGRDMYSLFDRDIRKTAMILEKSAIPVVLDNQPKLFGPGEAPSAALYCGWYSLGRYVDAFEWVKGAVGYHVASIEAISLHNPAGKYWVKSMIEKGVIATLGPVEEPYLQSFPRPSLFFPLLMSGKYTLAEVFAMTNPYLSWRMILIGDPLYNPFKNKPAFVPQLGFGLNQQ
jgi:uncharacterized protein (TIGR03790 family)